MQVWYFPVSGPQISFDEEALIRDANSKPMIRIVKLIKNRLPFEQIMHLSSDSETFMHAVMLKDVSFEIEISEYGWPSSTTSELQNITAEEAVALFTTFMSLLTMRTGLFFSYSFYADRSLKDLTQSEKGQLRFQTCPIPHLLGRESDGHIQREDAKWAADNISPVAGLLSKKPFSNAFLAHNNINNVSDESLALIVAWSGLESLFAIEAEHTFKLGVLISYYLESAQKRKELFDSLKKNYRLRSRFVHGASITRSEAHQSRKETFDVLRRALTKCIETRTLPNDRDILFPQADVLG
jgi:hypothetical protein